MLHRSQNKRVYDIGKVLVPLTIVFGFMGLLGGLNGCSSSGTSEQVDNSVTISTNGVIISQDTYDNDNFSLIHTAEKLSTIKPLLAVDVTGYDTGNRGGLLFSTLTDKPIFINQNHPQTRATPSSQVFTEIDNYPNDGLLDSQREDSTLELINTLHSISGKATYVVGGHLHNLSYLLQADRELVSNKIDKVVISVGATHFSGKPEMNLSQGVYTPTGTSEATRYVFTNLPKHIPIIVVQAEPFFKRSVSIIANEALQYLVKYGHYRDGTVKLGDFLALLYGVVGTTWYGAGWGVEVKTCFNVTDYGSLTLSSGDCNHYYINNLNKPLISQIYEELLKTK